MKIRKVLLKYRYCIVFFLLIGLFMFHALGMQAQEEQYAYVTIERSTIGEGFILKPTRVLIADGDTYADIFLKACNQNGITCNSTGNVSDGSYHFSGIYNGDNGFVRIPMCIRNLPDCNLEESQLNKYAPELTEGSFLKSSGWMFSVNGTFLNTGMADHGTLPQNGDVIRVQFSVYGNGADLGRRGENGVALQLANKTALIRLAGEVHANETKWFVNSGCKEAYENALEVLAQLDSTAASVDKALTDLKSFENASDSATDNSGSGDSDQKTDEPTDIESSLSEKELTSILKKIRKYTVGQDTIPGPGSEWKVLGMMRSSLSAPDSYQKTFYKNILKEMAEKEGVLSDTKYTEYSKLILTVTSMGKDARSIGGYNLFKPLANYGKVKKQGAEGAIWALLAVNSNSSYTFPKTETGTQTTKKKLVEYVLKQQISNGGFSNNGKTGNVNLTAKALQALAPYYDSRKDVKSSVDKAIEYLSKKQKDNGGFTSGGVVNSESSSQVITALTSLGIDPATDPRFVKNGKSALDGLLAFYLKDRGFAHTSGSGYNAVSTEQGYYALAAYERFLKEKTSLYDMSDIKIKKDTTKAKVSTKKSSSSSGTGSSKSSGTNSSKSSGNGGVRIVFQRGINFNGTGIAGGSTGSSSSSSESKKKKVSDSLIMTKNQLFKIANKDKSLSVKGKTKSGKTYRFTIQGTDVEQVLEFNGTITEDDTYKDDMALLADVLQCFRVEQEDFPGRMMLEIDTENEDGTYGLYEYDPVYRTAKLVSDVDVKNSRFSFEIEQGGLYYIALDSLTSVSGSDDLESDELKSADSLETEDIQSAEESVEDKTLEHILAVIVLVGLLAIDFHEKRKKTHLS